jgi:phosphotransferase system enzyme I (PtsI)
MTISVLRGIAASSGVALGPACVVRTEPSAPRAEAPSAATPADELTRWRTAQHEVSAALDELAERARTQVGAGEAEIFEAQALMVADPCLEELVSAAIQEGSTAEFATRQSCETFQQQLLALDEDYLRQRADDVSEVGHGLLRALAGQTPFGSLHLPSGAVVCADTLSAAALVGLDRAALGGLALSGGGPTSHVAILARTLGVPCVLGLGDFLDNIADGVLVGVDGDRGQVYLDPRASDLEYLDKAERRHAEERQQLAALVNRPTRTPDGIDIDVWANIGSLSDVEPALAAGATGIGLFRTEFLIAGRQTLPSEDEQYAIYRHVVEAFDDRPVVIRTFDVGGDKPVPALRLPPEDNPFLGYRAIRIGLGDPELLRTQLRAVARAGAGGHPVRVMLPMIATLEEVQQARAVLDSALEGDLERPQLGIMIEIPSAALNAVALAAEVDFFSIGTNDLTQYTLAADRTDERLAGLYQPFHPAVLRLIGMTAAAARSARIDCGVCGEMAGDPRATALLIGLGVTELSMSAGSIGYVKREVLRTSMRSAQVLATEALAMGSCAEVLEHVDAFRAGL